VPERDAGALAAALRSLIDDPERRRAMGVAGRRHVEAYHDVDKEARVLEERYLAVLARAAVQ
jgi:glycosyltransferase involved in cell wall biosynthesis